MARRLVHPWWGHLPAVTLFAGFVVFALSTSARWPARVPLRLSWGGSLVMSGSPWIAFGLVAAIGLIFLGLGVLVDELWARQEGRKRFNAFALLDDVAVGWLVGTQLGMTLAMLQAPATYGNPWGLAAACAGGAGLVALLLERWRPFASAPDVPAETAPARFARAIAERVKRGERIVYWDIQNPRYVNVVSLGVPGLMWVGAGLSIGESPWASLVLVLTGLALLLFYGGMRTRVTKDAVTIRYGLFGIRVFRCATGDISSIRLRQFAALREFGGYGIRFSGSRIGYFLAGSMGVEIGRPGQRSVLIGSDHPKRLAAALGAVAGIVPAEDGAEDVRGEGRVDG